MSADRDSRRRRRTRLDRDPDGDGRPWAARTRALVRAALELTDPDAGAREALVAAAERFDAPLVVGVLGGIKAGKSTLVNALVGQRVAATGTSDCTVVPVRYRYGQVSHVTVRTRDGRSWTSPSATGPGGLEVDLRGLGADELDHVDVAWPADALRHLTLVDTPGTGSAGSVTSPARDGAGGVPDVVTRATAGADATLYLVRQLRRDDLQALRTIRAARGGSAGDGPVLVVSRADEVGAGRIDAMVSAERVAARYAVDPALEGLCGPVVAVSGLLAEAARSLSADEVARLREIAGLDRRVVEDLLLSVDRFRRPSLEVPVPASTRAHLLERLGLFGVRTGVALLRGSRTDARELGADLVRRSGVAALEGALLEGPYRRRDLARACDVLPQVLALLADDVRTPARELAAEAAEHLDAARSERAAVLVGRGSGGAVGGAVSARDGAP